MKPSKLVVPVLTGMLLVAGSAFAADSGHDAYARAFNSAFGTSIDAGSGLAVAAIEAQTRSVAAVDPHLAYYHAFYSTDDKSGEGNGGQAGETTTTQLASTTSVDPHAAYKRALQGIAG